MKWFYIIAGVVTTGLVAFPLMYLKPEPAGQFDGLVIGYDDAGKPIRKARAVVLYDGYSSTLRSIDPVTCGDVWSSIVQNNTFEGLYTYHYLKRPPAVIPQLAEAMPEISDDGLTYTIRIRKGVRYSRNPCFGTEADGRGKTRTVRAQDFVLSFKRCGDFHIAPALPWSFLNRRVKGLAEFREKTKAYEPNDFSRYDLDVEGIRALDDHTIRIRLAVRFPQFIYVLAMHGYAPTPREAVDYWLGRSDPPLTEFRKPESLVGTGPYLLKTFEAKNKIILVRNPEFRPDFYPSQGDPGDRELGLLDDAGKRVPFIDAIRYDWMPLEYSLWMTFLTKRKDVAAIPRETFESVITPGKELTDQWRNRRIYLRKSWWPAIYWIVFNMEDKVLGASKTLRQAICLAYDVENHIKVLYNGRGKPAVNIIPSTFAGHAEVGPGPYHRFDLPAARKKLAVATKELAAAGLLGAGGRIPELSMDITRGDKAATLGEFVKQQFRNVGISVKITYNDWSTQQSKVNNKQVQMYTMGWHADYPDAENFFQLFYSVNIAESINDSNYSDPEFDKWYEAARVMPETPERMALYVKMARKISEDCPVLLLSEPLGFSLYYDWVSNVKAHPIGYGFTKYRKIDYDLRTKLGGRN